MIGIQRFLCLALSSCLFLNACSSSQVVIKHTPAQNEKVRVAVLPFKDAPDQPGSGQVATEAFTTQLLSCPSYEIIERGSLEQVMKEQNLSVTGAIDPKTASELGKLLGADAIVVGAVTEYQARNNMIFPPAKATVSARMVRTATGTIDWSGNGTVGWHPLKWVASIFWPVGVFFLVTSPTAQDRTAKASQGIAKVVLAKSKI